MNVFGYPATDPVRDFERQSCCEIESEAARLSRLEGRAVDQFGFTVRRTVATKPSQSTWRREERLKIARWSAQARAEMAAELAAARESFDVPPLSELQTVAEQFPHAAEDRRREMQRTFEAVAESAAALSRKILGR